MKLALICMLLAGCSIKDLDLAGKPCPCPGGYVCNTSSMTCAVGPPGDSGAIDAPGHPGDSRFRDAPADVSTASCVLSPLTAPYYATATFADFGTAWTAIGATWSVNSGELDQTSVAAQLPYAYHTVGPADYRVVSTMHELGGGQGDALEIAIRIDPTMTDMYHCNWEPEDGGFLIMHTDMGMAGPANVLSQTQIALNTVQDPKTVTMEFQIVGTELQCCLRGIGAAYLTAGSALYPAGAVGLKTYEMSGAFYDFAIYD